MPETSYKILAAKRLAVDPNAILMYFELNERAIVTAPDGEQHIFTFAELRKPVQNATEPVDRNQVKPKTVAKPKK